MTEAKILRFKDVDELQSLHLSYPICQAARGVDDVSGLDRSDVGTELIELPPPRIYVGTERLDLTLHLSESAFHLSESALQGLESALGGGGEVGELPRQVEHRARQQPLAQRFQPLRVLIKDPDEVVYRRDLKRTCSPPKPHHSRRHAGRSTCRSRSPSATHGNGRMSGFGKSAD